MSYRHSAQAEARRAFTALALILLVSLAPAAQSFSLWDYLVNLLVGTDAGVRIDDNGFA